MSKRKSEKKNDGDDNNNKNNNHPRIESQKDLQSRHSYEAVDNGITAPNGRTANSSDWEINSNRSKGL